MSKKGQALQAVPGLAILLVIAAVVLTIGTGVVETISQSQCTSGFNSSSGTCNVGDKLGYSYNISQNGMKGINSLSSYQPTIGIVVAAAVIIGIILAAFRFGEM